MAYLAAPLGLLLAWGGLLLPWRRWSAEAGDGSSSGFHEATAFWIVLAVVTLLVLVARFARYSLRDRERRWVHAAVAVGALALVGIGVRAIAGFLAESSAFVSVGPGVGSLLSLLGALIVLAAELVALAPARRVLAAALGAGLVVVAVAALWPADDGRPGAGAIAEVSEDNSRGIALADGTLYGVDEVYLSALPRPGRAYEAVLIDDTGWVDSIADGFVRDIAFVGDELYGVLGSAGRIGTLTPGGKAEVVPGAAGVLAIAEAPDDGVHLLTADGVSVLRDDRVTEVADIELANQGRDEFAARGDIASDGKGGAYVADTGNGRVLHVDAKGRVTTVVGTDAAPGCVTDGHDDPLTLDPARCTGVVAVAADDDGNLYLALRSLAVVLGLTPEGHMAVVAGTGPAGWSDGGGDAAQAHLGQVNGLQVGPDGDLYIDEDHPLDRVRRVADPAGLLDDPRPQPQAPSTDGACGAIARVRAAFVSNSGPNEVDEAIAALERTAPDELQDRVDDLRADYERHRDAGESLTEVIWAHNGFRKTLADYAEDECGLIAGYNLTARAVNRYCLAYRRYLDTHESLPAVAEDPPPEWAAVEDAAPDTLEFANPRVAETFTSSVCVDN
jgi:hypothetical protein